MSIWRFMFDDPVWRETQVEALATRRRRDTRLFLHRARDAEGRIDSLEEQIRELTLVCRSLLDLMVESGTVSPEHFERVMRRIDGQSSLSEGRMPSEPVRQSTTWSRRRD